MCSGLPTLVLGDVSAPVLHDLTSASLPDPVSLGSPSSVGELVLSSHTPKETSAIPEVVSLAPAWGYRDLFSWWKQEQGVVRFMWELMMQGVGSDCGDSKTHFFFFDWCSNNIKDSPGTGFMLWGPLMSVSCVVLTLWLCRFLLCGCPSDCKDLEHPWILVSSEEGCLVIYIESPLVC